MYIDIVDLLNQNIAYEEYFNPETPLIAGRRPKNLRDKLVSSEFKERTKQEDTNGCKPYGKTECSWRWKMNFTTTWSETKGERTFNINHKLDYYSANDEM